MGTLAFPKDVTWITPNGYLSCLHDQSSLPIANRGKSVALVLVDEVLRPVPGGSQSLLVRSDSSLYIVKCPYNGQGPNVLANEFLGTQLMAALGLPTLKWHFAQFRVPQACPQCSEQMQAPGRRPLHFASEVLTSISGSQQVFESIPRSHFHRIENRTDFLNAFIFDTWAGSTDHRQALFVKNNNSDTYRAFFIDNGHLFGGPNWNSASHRGIALTRDNAIYGGILNSDLIEDILFQMREAIPLVLPRVFASLPNEWRSSGAFWLEEALLSRLFTLRGRILKEIGSTFSASPHFSELQACI